MCCGHIDRRHLRHRHRCPDHEQAGNRLAAVEPGAAVLVSPVIFCGEGRSAPALLTYRAGAPRGMMHAPFGRRRVPT
jgi:hypothetical protein